MSDRKKQARRELLGKRCTLRDAATDLLFSRMGTGDPAIDFNTKQRIICLEKTLEALIALLVTPLEE